MFRSRFLWKLYAGHSAIILVFALAIGIFICEKVKRDALVEIEQSLQARAVLLQDAARKHFSEGFAPGYQAQLQNVGATISTRLTVIDVDGTVIGDSEELPAAMDSHDSRPEVLAARDNGRGVATRFSDTLGVEMMYLALPVRNGGELVGYVRASLPLSLINERIHYIQGVVVLWVSIAAVVALGLELLLVRHFVGPLSSMTSLAESMAEGNYDQRLPFSRNDEVGTLAQALNRMAESCRDRMETITTERHKLSSILTGMVEGVIAIDLQERVMHMNEACGAMLDVSHEESLGRPIVEATRVREISDVLAAVLGKEEIVRRTLCLASPAGERVVAMHASPLYDGQNELAGAAVVLYDVSELRRLERVRRDFVANVSHELKTPITAVRAVVETLIDDNDMPADQRERFLGKIRDQSVRLSAMVTDLLALSHLESDAAGPELQPVDLVQVAKESVQVLSSMATYRGVSVRMVLPESSVRVNGDADGLGQIVSNLLSNALKYTPPGGKVSVRIAAEAGNAIIEVKDSGIGIAPENQERIFERFYRVDRARSRELGGTGLGLSIVKHIVLAHGGVVSVDSTLGHGSTFRVSIPLMPIS